MSDVRGLCKRLAFEDLEEGDVIFLRVRTSRILRGRRDMCRVEFAHGISVDLPTGVNVLALTEPEKLPRP